MFHACVSLLYAIDLSKAACSVPTWRLRVISRSFSLLNVCLPMILSLALQKVTGSRVMSSSVDCDCVVLLVYIQLTLVSDWSDILTALAGWSHSVPLVLLYTSFL